MTYRTVGAYMRYDAEAHNGLHSNQQRDPVFNKLFTCKVNEYLWFPADCYSTVDKSIIIFEPWRKFVLILYWHWFRSSRISCWYIACGWQKTFPTRLNIWYIPRENDTESEKKNDGKSEFSVLVWSCVAIPWQNLTNYGDKGHMDAKSATPTIPVNWAFAIFLKIRWLTYIMRESSARTRVPIAIFTEQDFLRHDFRQRNETRNLCHKCFIQLFF